MTTNNNPSQSPIDWGAVQADLDSGTSGSTWFFPGKNPNARIRLLHSPNDERPFVAVKTEYQGKVREKYLLYMTEAENGPVKVLIVTKTAFRAIVSLLANGWDLFDPQAGIPIIISKFTAGGRTNYAVTPAGAKPMPVKAEVVEELDDLSLTQARQDFDDWQVFMAEKRANGEHGDED